MGTYLSGTFGDGGMRAMWRFKGEKDVRICIERMIVGFAEMLCTPYFVFFASTVTFGHIFFRY